MLKILKKERKEKKTFSSNSIYSGRTVWKRKGVKSFQMEQINSVNSNSRGAKCSSEKKVLGEPLIATV